MRRILVIKLGALGDFIHAFHPFAAIRAAHPAARISLLTTQPFRAVAEASPWFDEVLVDARAAWWNVPAIWRTVAQIRNVDFVYDLQTSARSGRYFHLAGRPPWSGIARGCSHPHANPLRDSMHTLERQREQLAHAGMTAWPPPEREWLVRMGSRHGIAPPYAMLVPGGAGMGAVKRWPIAQYAAVAQHLHRRGIAPVIIGGPEERPKAQAILAACPESRDLTGRTTIADLAALASGAAVVLGNDTGPVHVASSTGAPTVSLFAPPNDPGQVAPRGPNGEWATVLQAPRLSDLSLNDVLAALNQALQRPAGVPTPPPSPRPAAERTSPQSAVTPEGS